MANAFAEPLFNFDGVQAEGPQNGASAARPLVLHLKMGSGDSSVKIFDSVPFDMRVIDFWAVMHGAGASGDTVNLTDGSNSIIGGAIDVSSAGDTDVLRAVEMDNAYWDLDKGDDLVVATASGALVDCYVKVVGLK